MDIGERLPAAPAATRSGDRLTVSAMQTLDKAIGIAMKMECFQPDQLPVLNSLASEFVFLNFWYSSLPAPTWPNRFFVHAATSGGLTDSPSTGQILEGFSFP